MQMRYFIVYRPTLTLKNAFLVWRSLVKLSSEEYVPHIFNLREICLDALHIQCPQQELGLPRNSPSM